MYRRFVLSCLVEQSINQMSFTMKYKIDGKLKDEENLDWSPIFSPENFRTHKIGEKVCSFSFQNTKPIVLLLGFLT